MILGSGPGPAALPARRRARWRGLAVAALFLAYGLQGAALIRETSPTTDEVAFHMVNGYAYLMTQDYRMSPANPPLVRQWMALPWLLIRPRLDLEKTSWKEADSVPFAREVFYRDNRAIADRLLYASRTMILALGFLLGFFLYRWSTELYGPDGGLLTLAFYAFCPNLLAHASIAHTDLGVTAFVGISAYFLWRYLERRRALDFWLWTAAFGLAAAAKYNALALAPWYLLALGFRKGWRDFFRGAFCLGAVTFLTVWAACFFEFRPLLAEGVPRTEEKVGHIKAISGAFFPGDEAAAERLVDAARRVPIPAPSYLLGVAGIVRSHRAPYLHYAFGRWSDHEHCWYFYLFSFAAKMTLPFLTLFVLRALFFRKSASAAGHENAVILLPAAAYAALTMFDSTLVGLRYLLPVIAPLFVWIGGLSKIGGSARGLFWSAAAIAHAVSALAVFPQYLAHYHPLAGGVEAGYRYSRGSDNDWGQGLKALKRYQDQNGLERISLYYFGTADPAFYGLRTEPWTREERETPGKKVYALSLYYLEHAAWAKSIKPTALVGGSIFVYDLRNSA